MVNKVKYSRIPESFGQDVRVVMSHALVNWLSEVTSRMAASCENLIGTNVNGTLLVLVALRSMKMRVWLDNMPFIGP